jgi:hypothetical protein
VVEQNPSIVGIKIQRGAPVPGLAGVFVVVDRMWGVQVAQDYAGSDPVDDDVGSQILVVTANIDDVALMRRSMLEQATNPTDAWESDAATSSVLLTLWARR